MSLKHQYIEANTLEDAWFLTLYRIIDEGRVYTIDRGSFAGQKRLEFDYVTIKIKNPSKGNLIPKIPEIYNIDNPVCDGYVEDYCQRYLMGHELAKNESYTYGQRITRYPISEPIEFFKSEEYKDILIQDINILLDLGIIIPGDKDDAHSWYLNQIELIIWLYKNKGHRNNQTVLQIATPTDLLLQDPPCLRQVQVRIQDGSIHFFPYFRSWDLWNGFSANLGGIQILKMYMAEMIGVEDGEIIASSGGLHIYDYAFDLAKILRARDDIMLKLGNN